MQRRLERFSRLKCGRGGSRPFRLYLLALVVWWAGLCPPGSWAGAPLVPAKLAQMDAAIEQAISEDRLPGGVLWVEHKEQRYQKAFGQRTLGSHAEPMTEDTIFDAASMTKVLATTPLVMRLWERGRLKLDEPVRTYLPDFKGGERDKITIRHLLTHCSGFDVSLGRNPTWSGYEQAIAMACAEKPSYPPGTVFHYCDINFILLGEVVQRLGGRKLNEMAAEEVFGPLRMTDTGYLPGPDKLARIAPTARNASVKSRRVVHDPTTRRMGGVAGQAGVFTTAADMARFARMMLGGGELEGIRILKPETVELMIHVQSPAVVEARRGLGWDIDSDYSRPRGNVFPIGSYGHTGFTGVCLWVDPFSETFWMFLSNRVYANQSANILALQRGLGTLAAESVADFNFSVVPGALPARSTEPAPRPPESASKSGADSRRILQLDPFTWCYYYTTT